MDVFYRYHKANEIVETLPNGEKRDHLREAARHLLHLEQGRIVAIQAYQKYSDEMNRWENNILESIKREAEGGNRG